MDEKTHEDDEREDKKENEGKNSLKQYADIQYGLSK